MSQREMMNNASSDQMPTEAHVNAVMKCVKDRIAKLPVPVPHEVAVSLHHAEMNFWMQPYQTYHGGLAAILVYLKGDGNAFPVFMECPGDVDGRNVNPFMWDVLRQHDAKLVVYTATGKSDRLMVIAMAEKVLFNMRCPMLLHDGGEFSLGEWVIERSKPGKSAGGLAHRPPCQGWWGHA